MILEGRSASLPCYTNMSEERHSEFEVLIEIMSRL
jgi:hypothetical protein